MQGRTRRSSTSATAIAALPTLGISTAVHAQPKKPNIVVIFGDDIGQSNVGAYSMEPEPAS